MINVTVFTRQVTVLGAHIPSRQRSLATEGAAVLGVLADNGSPYQAPLCAFTVTQP